MRIILTIVILFLTVEVNGQRFVERSGQATFFSEAPLENISATNDQVLAVTDQTTGEVAVTMLMKGFQFRKALMQEHFNESYVESDKFPKATFTGTLLDYSPEKLAKRGTIKVSGDLTIHGITRNLETEVTIIPTNSGFRAEATFEVIVADFEIEIPDVVSENIARVVEVTINLNLQKENVE